jgi:hypothetical protein
MAECETGTEEGWGGLQSTHQTAHGQMLDVRLAPVGTVSPNATLDCYGYRSLRITKDVCAHPFWGHQCANF